MAVRGRDQEAAEVDALDAVVVDVHLGDVVGAVGRGVLGDRQRTGLVGAARPRRSSAPGRVSGLRRRRASGSGTSVLDFLPSFTSHSSGVRHLRTHR